MCWRNSLWTIALCFGLGLGLAPAVRSAHACSCIEHSGWVLNLEQITGEGDPIVEEAFWSRPTGFSTSYDPDALLNVANDRVWLRRVQ
jgi:hypothetical protein